jgi:uncharacterized membrane protein YvbJ
MALIKCTECGHDVSDRAKICPHCGVEIAGQVITCPRCGQVNFKDATHCSFCHTQFVEENKIFFDDKNDSDTLKDIVGLKSFKQFVLKEMRMPTTTIVTGVVFMIVIFVGLYFKQVVREQNEFVDYQEALSSKQSSVMQNYLDMYEHAPKAHRENVKRHLEMLDGGEE